MKEQDLWNTFEKTGSVVDYLNYKGVMEQKDDIGEKIFESEGNSDRDDIVRNTYR